MKSDNIEATASGLEVTANNLEREAARLRSHASLLRQENRDPVPSTTGVEDGLEVPNLST